MGGGEDTDSPTKGRLLICVLSQETQLLQPALASEPFPSSLTNFLVVLGQHLQPQGG